MHGKENNVRGGRITLPKFSFWQTQALYLKLFLMSLPVGFGIAGGMYLIQAVNLPVVGIPLVILSGLDFITMLWYATKQSGRVR